MDDLVVWDVDGWLVSLLDDPETYDGKIEDLTVIKLKSGPVYVGDYHGHTDTHLSIKPYGTKDIVTFERTKIQRTEAYDDESGYMMEIDFD